MPATCVVQATNQHLWLVLYYDYYLSVNSRMVANIRDKIAL